MLLKSNRFLKFTNTNNCSKWFIIQNYKHSTNNDDNNGDKETITLKWIKDGDEDGKIIITENVPIGISILEAAHQNKIDLEGACESSLACSTCHVILEDNIYDKLNEPEDDEYDLLDLAFGLTETSRLGCQIILDKLTSIHCTNVGSDQKTNKNFCNVLLFL